MCQTTVSYVEHDAIDVYCFNCVYTYGLYNNVVVLIDVFLMTFDVYMSNIVVYSV